MRSRNHAPKNAVSLIVATQFHIEIDMTSKAYVFTNVCYLEILKLCSEYIISRFSDFCKWFSLNSTAYKHHSCTHKPFILPREGWSKKCRVVRDKKAYFERATTDFVTLFLLDKHRRAWYNIFELFRIDHFIPLFRLLLCTTFS